MMDTVQAIVFNSLFSYYFSIIMTVKKVATVYRYHNIFESKSVTYSDFFLKCTTCTKFIEHVIQHLDNRALILNSVNHNTTENY